MTNLSVLLCEYGELENNIYRRMFGSVYRSETWGVLNDKSWFIKRVPNITKRILKKPNDASKNNA